MHIYVIVENIPTLDYNVEEVLCRSLGYWTEDKMQELEAKVFTMNEKAEKDHPDMEEYVDRFGIVLIDQHI